MKDFREINDIDLLKSVTAAKISSLNSQLERIKKENDELRDMLLKSELEFNKLLSDKLTDQEKYRYFEKTFKKASMKK